MNIYWTQIFENTVQPMPTLFQIKETFSTKSRTSPCKTTISEVDNSG